MFAVGGTAGIIVSVPCTKRLVSLLHTTDDETPVAVAREAPSRNPLKSKIKSHDVTQCSFTMGGRAQNPVRVSDRVIGEFRKLNSVHFENHQFYSESTSILSMTFPNSRKEFRSSSRSRFHSPAFQEDANLPCTVFVLSVF